LSGGEPTILLALLVGAVSAYLELRSPGYSVAGVVAVASFTAFVVIFARAWFAWFVRDLRGSLETALGTHRQGTGAS
jgi:hypothetical protein